MEFKKLKKFVENNMLSDSILIFENWDTFLSDQYISAIANNKQLPIRYIESIDFILDNYDDIFYANSAPTELLVYKCNEFICSNKSILREKNLIIITDKITDKSTLDIVEDIIIKAPKIESKHIDEYIEVYASNLKPAQRKWLADACNNNLYRISQEIDKLNLFPKKDQANNFDTFMLDGIFSDLSTETILDFIEAIVTKNLKVLIKILENISIIDIEPLGVITLLYRNLKLILTVQFNKNITAEELNIKPGYLYMIKKKCGYYSKEELINAFNIVTKLEYKLKQGEIAESNIIDYILVNIL